jgi:sirohydrochlorin cobaltochelatase
VARSALVLFAHGSRDPEWAKPFRTIQQRVAARSADVTVDLAFLELMPPTLIDAVDRMAADGHRRVTIAPLFMAQGAHLKRDLATLMTDVEQRHPGIELTLLPPAGEVEGVLDAMAAWLASAVSHE